MDNTEGRYYFDRSLEEHNHEDYLVDIALADNHVLKDFAIKKNVLRADQALSVYLARWLFYNNGLYMGKNVVDMGSGSGLQGIVTGIYGASYVTFSDKSSDAFKNTAENVKRYSLDDKSIVLQGDLFERVQGRHDMIIFNHPFFSEENIEQQDQYSAIFDDGALIHRFLDDAKHSLTPEGIIIMPYFHAAGPSNDPGLQAPKHGYKVFERMNYESRSGILRGRASIYELR